MKEDNEMKEEMKEWIWRIWNERYRNNESVKIIMTSVKMKMKANSSEEEKKW